jgi:hypothetical protein
LNVGHVANLRNGRASEKLVLTPALTCVLSPRRGLHGARFLERESFQRESRRGYGSPCDVKPGNACRSVGNQARPPIWAGT